MEEKDKVKEAAKAKAPKLSKAKARKVMADTLNLAQKMGSGAASLLGRLKKDKSPAAMIATMEEGMNANRERQEVVSGRVERLYQQIADKKKQHAKAPPARKKILESELKSKLAEYKAAERELNVLFENQRVLSQVSGRLNEMVAYDLATVTEDMIDDVAMDIEDKVLDAEGRQDASRDLEKAGTRRDRESDSEELWDELAGFEEESEAPGEAASESPAGDSRKTERPALEETEPDERRKEAE